MTRPVVLASVGALAVAALVGAWRLTGDAQSVTVDEHGDRQQTVLRGQLPVFAQPREVADLYRYAAEQGDTLRHFPCTCGCGAIGHTSNRSCYIKQEAGDRITFTSHAAT
jgi:hypothetical protein